MKTERRHDLETNTLAKGLTDWSEKLRPYTSALLAAIALLLVIYIGASMWNSYQGSRERAAWDDYQMAVFNGDVEMKAAQRVAQSEDHAGTEMQEWAFVAWADRQLLQAAHIYLSNREDAKQRLTDIAATYETYAENAASPEVRNRARLGLARLYEMQGNLEEAKKQYGQVGGALAEIATARVTALESENVEEAVNWLATAELPKPQPPTGPGTPGTRPGFDSPPPAADPAADPTAGLGAGRTMEEIIGGIDLSEGEDRYPSLPEDDAVKPPAASEPAAPTEPPAAETPATEAPAIETPATESTDTPAEEPAAPPAEGADAADEETAPAPS